MSRGSKYSAEEKLKIVEACLSGAIGVREAGRRVGADGKTIGRWISWYKAEGSSAFMPAERNRIYPVELKQQVVEEYLTGKGSVQNKYENLLNRQFHADRSNSKWVTDISYIQTVQGVLYLSMIRDFYDNSIVAYKTATQQTVNLVLDTIRLAMNQEKKTVAAELQLHSDQGFQYTSQAYYNLTQEYGITSSMSRRGNCYDNAMAENFFSILKTECIYRHKPKTFAEANEMIDRYIHFYNCQRIQLKTGVAPLMLRHSA